MVLPTNPLFFLSLNVGTANPLFFANYTSHAVNSFFNLVSLLSINVLENQKKPTKNEDQTN